MTACVDFAAAVSWYCDVFGLVPELTLRVDALDLSIEMLIHLMHGYRLELLHRPGSETVNRPTHARPRCGRDTGTWRST
jgi:hypothetical protein